ncbi:ninein-like protein isoform X5 [Ambystoma mexicanum]|uniref:ninein-like protein isoform X5 n=1 Tax=Ambystoma mexicanum TaxID=8296 RepID=UPI0037E8BE2C
MDKDEENKYVSQLSEVFSSCDTTGTGYLDKDELTELCRKLHLEAQLPILLQTLLGNDHFARVNFEEFKEGFVAVLSRTIDLSISEDESSYLQPVIPEEVKPKFVKGAKRYGRRSRPEVQASNVESTKYLQEHQVNGNRKSQLRRSSSLESVESLKSDEEAESGKDAQNEIFEAQGEMRSWNADILDSPRRASSPCSDMTENQVRDIWIELDVGNNGYLNKQELATVCQSIGLKDLKNEEVEDLFHKLDQDGDGRVSFKEFQLGLFSHGPTSLPITSTPFRQKRQWSLHQALEESGRTPSLLSSCGGLHLFSSIDDGTGFVNPEQIITIWEQEGLEDSKEILQSLDFSLEEQVNLADLTMILDKEMATTQSRVHQAGLASYRQELQHLRGQVEQISREKEKVKKDFERAEMRNRQLTSEVDDHHSVMELLNQSKISDLEHDYKEKVAAVRSELVKESEMLVQQADQQRAKLEADLSKMQREDTVVREKLTLCLKENSRLQKEMMEVVGRASESEKSVLKLQKDLDLMLSERCKFMDPQSTEHFDREERFAEIIREYETQCRELRDRNDELQVELEKLRSQLNENKHHNLLSRRKDLKQLLMKSKINSNLNAENLGKNKLSFKLGRSSSTLGINGIISKEINPNSYPLSIEAELTKEQLKEHQQQLQDLRIQLETKVNYYEREIELMKRNYEQERKDTEQGFKIEVSELEEQKSDLEELNAKLEDVIKGLKDQLQKLPQSQEIEKRFEKERAEMEQNYAKEISNLAQSLTQEREQLKVELKRSHQHELQFTRIELNRLSEDNCVLKNNIEKVQQEVDAATAENRKWRINAEKLQNEIAAYTHQNKTFKDEVGLLTDRNLQLSDAVADLCAKAEESQQTIQLLNQRLAELSGQKEEEAAVARQLQETVESLEREQIQKESTWMRECGRSAQELHTLRETVTNMTSRHQLLQMEKEEMLKEAEVNKRKVAKMTFEHQLLQQEKEETLQEAEENKKQVRKEVLNLTLQLELLQQEKEGILQEIEENKKQLANLTLQHQLLQQEKETFLREAEENQKKLFRMDSLMQEVNALKLEKHCLEDRCQGMAKGLKDYADQVPRMHTIESELQRVNLECQALRQKEAQLREELVTAQHQVSQMHRLESELQRVNLECQALRPKEAQLREELLAAQDQAAQMHRLESELQRVNLECQTLRQKEAQLREELVEAQDQLLEANTRLTLAESQHMREVQHLKEKIHGAVPKDQLNKLQAKLQEAQEKVRQLQESLRLQAEQAHKQLALQQEQHEKLLRRMEEKMLEVEMNLKTVRVMLQEKVKQLKEQLEKNAKSDMLLKDLYVENAQLMKALQVTEQRQKSAEKKNFILDEKIAALNKLIRNIAPASLSA